MLLSIIIPAYNEERRIEPTLDCVRAYINEKGIEAEIIVVNDGSTDGTSSILDGQSDLNAISFETNRGKGAAVREGMKAAKGDALLITDADLSTPIEEAGRLISKLEEGYDIVIGSRGRGITGVKIEKYQPPVRLALGVTFGVVVRFAYRLPYMDTQCGFKVMTGEAAKALVEHMQIDGFTFDVEMLGIAQKMGLRVAEIGVRWKDVHGSKLKPGRDFTRIISELLQIRRNLKEFKL